MDQVKTGEFIAQKRKDLGLTQRQLADTLGVSDKTVSKWECGKSMPDYSLMQAICKELHISVNELLAGEILEEADYKNKAEETIMDLMEQKKNEEQKSGRILLGAMIGLFFLIVVFGFAVVSGGGFMAFRYIADMPTLIFMIAMEVVILTILRLHMDFLRAIRIFLLGAKNDTDLQLKKSIYAMKVMLQTTLLSGAIMTLVGISIWGYNIGYYDNYDCLAAGPGFAVAIIALLYACVAALLFYVIKSKLEILLNKREDIY